MRFFYVAVDKQIGCAAAAGTIKSCPAVSALFSSIDIERGKSAGQLFIEGPVVQTAQPVCLVAHELMTGIDISLWRNRHIFAACTAPAQPFDDTGPLSQIHVEMKEIDPRMVPQIFCQTLLLSL